MLRAQVKRVIDRLAQYDKISHFTSLKCVKIDKNIEMYDFQITFFNQTKKIGEMKWKHKVDPVRIVTNIGLQVSFGFINEKDFYYPYFVQGQEELNIPKMTREKYNKMKSKTALTRILKKSASESETNKTTLDTIGLKTVEAILEKFSKNCDLEYFKKILQLNLEKRFICYNKSSEKYEMYRIKTECCEFDLNTIWFNKDDGCLYLNSHLKVKLCLNSGTGKDIGSIYRQLGFVSRKDFFEEI